MCIRDRLKASLGLEEQDVPGGVEVTGVVASGWLGELLDDALHATVERVPTPEAFSGKLRPYQERGVGWLGFLGRFGLGGCLADDMGLGKTAQVIASLLVDDDVGRHSSSARSRSSATGNPNSTGLPLS